MSEPQRSTDSHPRLLREGEVSPYKILVSILLREFYTRIDLRPIQPKSRISLGTFFYKLISNEDMSYKSLLSICKNQKWLPSDVFLAFVRIVENLEEENTCFLNELVMTVIDMVDTSQTIILRKRIAKTSPLGKFLRLLMLSIRKMSYPQVFHLYSQLWSYVKKDDLQNLKEMLEAKIEMPKILINKVICKLHFLNRPTLQKGIKPRRGLDIFNEAMNKRSSTGRVGLGPNLNFERTDSTTSAVSSNTPLLKNPDDVALSKDWDKTKWSSRKIIERTIRSLSSEFYTTKSLRYTPRQISSFIESIRHNPSSQVLYSQLNFLEYLNCLKLKDVSRCSDFLRTAFDFKIKAAPPELTKGTPYAAYNFALFYDFMGYEGDTISLLGEAFQAAHASCDKLCLHFCNNLWASMHCLPYKTVIQESFKDMDKCLSFLHSFNVILATFQLQTSGSRPLEVFQTLWKRSTGFDFENTESIIIISLANLFSILGDIKAVQFIIEPLLFTSHIIKWPVRSYASALLFYGSSEILEGNFSLGELILDYGESLFHGDGSMAGETFGKYRAIYQAMVNMLGRRPIPESVIAIIRGYDILESSYWNAYNQMLRKDWQKSDRLIRRAWELLKEKTYENGDISIRLLLLEAEICCLSGNPSGALQPLFQALQLSKKFSADFYITSCQLSISTIQIFLGLPSTAAKTLELDTLVKCRSTCNVLEAKLCVVAAKISMEILSSSPTPPSNCPVKEISEMFSLFTKSAEEVRDEVANVVVRDVVPTKRPNSYPFTQNDAKLAYQIGQYLDVAAMLYDDLDNDYLLDEVLYLQRQFCKLTEKFKQGGMVEGLEEKLAILDRDGDSYYTEICLI